MSMAGTPFLVSWDHVTPCDSTGAMVSLLILVAVHEDLCQYSPGQARLVSEKHTPESASMV